MKIDDFSDLSSWIDSMEIDAKINEKVKIQVVFKPDTPSEILEEFQRRMKSNDYN